MQTNANYILRVRQVVPTRTEELERIRQLVEDEARGFGFDQETSYRLALATDEACANIIQHAYEGNPTENFVLEIATEGNRFVIVLTDEGKGFDPRRQPAVDMSFYLKQMKRGGLGLHIIKLVMDDVAYDVAGNCANRLRMVKYLPTGTGA
jgi:serine/threonine-protein kinase RsbW